MIALLSFVERASSARLRFSRSRRLVPDRDDYGVGRLLFHVSAALAENDRDVIRERTIAGLAAVRARGRKGMMPVFHLDGCKDFRIT